MPRFFVALLLGLVAFVATSPAAGYCRKTTSSDNSESVDPARAGTCEAAAATALPLYWAKTCVEYRIVVDPALEAAGKMTTARAAEIVHRASAAWTAAQCPTANGATRPVAIKITDVAQSACSAEKSSVHNEVRFTSEPSDGDSLAATDVTFDAENGSVVTAKTRLFDVYADLGKTSEEIDGHVEYIVRHELGHFLGLAHSEQNGAVMNAKFRTRPSDGLTDDDVRGICDVYNPDAPIGAGCSMTREGGVSWSGSGAWGAVLIGLGLSWLAIVRRRRSAARIAAGLAASIVFITTTASAGGVAPKKTATAKGAVKKPAKPATRAAVRANARTEPSDEALASAVVETIPEPPVKAPAEVKAPAPAPSEPKVAAASAEAPVAVPVPRSAEVYFGVSYRAFMLPRAMLDVIGRANKDPIFHSVSAQADFHYASGFSIVPALTFADLSTGDMLVGSRSNDQVSSFSYVRSDLKALAASVELVWSLPVSRRVELELGLQLGVGVTFGSLVDTWVHETPDGSLEYGGRRFAPCKTVNDGVGCRPQDHGSPNPVRVGDYHEPGLFDGGSAPTLLPWVSLPLVGVRTRIGDDVALRVGVGASATGIWAGASLGYAVTRRSP